MTPCFLTMVFKTFGFKALDGRRERALRYGRMRGRRERARGEYRFLKLMRKKRGGEITLSFTSPEKEKYFLHIL